MSVMASQITSLAIVYSTVYSGADQRKHQSSASLAFVRGIHRWPVNSPHKGPVTRKMFLFDNAIMIPSICEQQGSQCTPWHTLKLWNGLGGSLHSIIWCTGFDLDICKIDHFNAGFTKYFNRKPIKVPSIAPQIQRSNTYWFYRDTRSPNDLRWLQKDWGCASVVVQYGWPVGWHHRHNINKTTAEWMDQVYSGNIDTMQAFQNILTTMSKHLTDADWITCRFLVEKQFNSVQEQYRWLSTRPQYLHC